MAKKYMCFFILIYLITKSKTKDNSFNTIKLEDLKTTPFSLNNKYIIFEYDNNIKTEFNSSINFIFSVGKKSSTKVYIYDSLDKIIMTDDGFEGYLNKTTLDSTKCIRISYADSFYRDNCTYYIVLYDISQKYQDSIYVVNSLKYLDFGNEIKFTCDFGILFNFLIEKDSLTYLHYQTSALDLLDTSYHINIENETGTNLINSYTNSESGYIEIKPKVKYYVHIRIYQPYEYEILEKTFYLNYEKYRNNILIKDNNYIKKSVLSSQNYTFFKSLSNLAINESIIIEGDCNTYNSDSDIYIKKYQDDNFEILYKEFPTKKSDYDHHLGKGKGFKYEIKKEYKEQKGILVGFFIDKKSSFTSSEISFRAYKAEPKKDEDDGGQKSQTDNRNSGNTSSKSSFPVIWIVCISIVLIIFIITLCIVCLNRMQRNKRRRENYDNLLQNENNNSNNYNVTQVNNNNNGNYNVTQVSNNDNYNSPNENINDANFNKIMPDDELGNDNYPALPAINGN